MSCLGEQIIAEEFHELWLHHFSLVLDELNFTSTKCYGKGGVSSQVFMEIAALAQQQMQIVFLDLFHGTKSKAPLMSGESWWQQTIKSLKNLIRNNMRKSAERGKSKH